MPRRLTQVTTLDAVILAGGLGTRLEPLVKDRPKALADVSGRPFIDILIDELVSQGVRRIIFCLGHRREQIISHVAGRADATFLFAEEIVPLGTGGALKNASSLISSDPFLLMNGDSFCRVAYAELMEFHKRRGAALTMVVSEARGRADAGNVTLTAEGRITGFREKSDATHPFLINAGIYLIRRAVLQSLSLQYPFSLERDILPLLIHGGNMYGYVVSEEVIDIGTPERLTFAQGKF